MQSCGFRAFIKTEEASTRRIIKLLVTLLYFLQVALHPPLKTTQKLPKTGKADREYCSLFPAEIIYPHIICIIKSLQKMPYGVGLPLAWKIWWIFTKRIIQMMSGEKKAGGTCVLGLATRPLQYVTKFLC